MADQTEQEQIERERYNAEAEEAYRIALEAPRPDILTAMHEGTLTTDMVFEWALHPAGDMGPFFLMIYSFLQTQVRERDAQIARLSAQVEQLKRGDTLLLAFDAGQEAALRGEPQDVNPIQRAIRGACRWSASIGTMEVRELARLSAEVEQQAVEIRAAGDRHAETCVVMGRKIYTLEDERDTLRSERDAERQRWMDARCLEVEQSIRADRAEAERDAAQQELKRWELARDRAMDERDKLTAALWSTQQQIATLTELAIDTLLLADRARTVAADCLDAEDRAHKLGQALGYDLVAARLSAALQSTRPQESRTDGHSEPGDTGAAARACSESGHRPDDGRPADRNANSGTAGREDDHPAPGLVLTRPQEQP